MMWWFQREFLFARHIENILSMLYISYCSYHEVFDYTWFLAALTYIFVCTTSYKRKASNDWNFACLRLVGLLPFLVIRRIPFVTGCTYYNFKVFQKIWWIKDCKVEIWWRYFKRICLVRNSILIIYIKQKSNFDWFWI